MVNRCDFEELCQICIVLMLQKLFFPVMETAQAFHLRSLYFWLWEFLDHIRLCCLCIPLVGVEKILASSFSSGSYFSIKNNHNHFSPLVSLELQLKEKHGVPFLPYVSAFGLQELVESLECGRASTFTLPTFSL